MVSVVPFGVGLFLLHSTRLLAVEIYSDTYQKESMVHGGIENEGQYMKRQKCDGGY